MGYNGSMIEVRQTEEFYRWVRRLRDANAVARIVSLFAAWSWEIWETAKAFAVA